MRPLRSRVMPGRLPLPALPRPPEVAQRERLSERDADGFDAILALVPAEAGDMPLVELPQSDRWRRLRAHMTAPGAVRSATLANASDTRAVLGILGPRATAFDALALAGRMLKEIAGEAEVIALAVPGARPASARRRGTARTGGIGAGTGGPRDATIDAAGDVLGALLSAALAHAFEMPSFRTPGPSAVSAPSGVSRPSRVDHAPSSRVRRSALRAEPRRRLRRIELVGSAPLDLPFLEAAAHANNVARFLTALPPNVLDARAYRRFITGYAREHGLQFTWLDETALERLEANAFLAVARGNAERTAGIAHLTYRPAASRRPRARGGARSSPPAAGGHVAPDVALVGKGILFDTGGTNLKPHRSMLEMHTDMAGSAVALATLGALSRLKAPLAVDAWLAITENRIGPHSYLPQEIVRAANGVTIQVIHTDAEGRMALADTLALAARGRPRLMIDFATLTGTCIYALTERMSGLVTNRPRLVPALLAAGRASGERVWNFPFDDDYDTDLESKVADVLQCSVEAKGDHILAARFLSRFVPEGTPWVHLDLSSAVRSGGLAHIPTDVTGFGTRYALELLLKTRVLDELGGS